MDTMSATPSRSLRPPSRNRPADLLNRPRNPYATFCCYCVRVFRDIWEYKAHQDGCISVTKGDPRDR
jgi:hypothetical protein